MSRERSECLKSWAACVTSSWGSFPTAATTKQSTADWGLKTPGVTVSQASGQKSKGRWWGACFCGGSSLPPAAAGTPIAAGLSLTLSPCPVFSVSSRTLVIGFGAHLGNPESSPLEILHSVTSAKTPSQNEATCLEDTVYPLHPPRGSLRLDHWGLNGVILSLGCSGQCCLLLSGVCTDSGPEDPPSHAGGDGGRHRAEARAERSGQRVSVPQASCHGAFPHGVCPQACSSGLRSPPCSRLHGSSRP